MIDQLAVESVIVKIIHNYLMKYGSFELFANSSLFDTLTERLCQIEQKKICSNILSILKICGESSNFPNQIMEKKKKLSEAAQKVLDQILDLPYEDQLWIFQQIEESEDEEDWGMV